MTDQDVTAPTGTPAGTPAGHPELVALVDLWRNAIADFVALAEELTGEEWATPTDLPGWDVHAVVAHTAHLEALQAGRDHDDVEVGDAPHVRNDLGRVTEQGVVARRDRSPAELVAEIRESTDAHHATLLAAPPTDPDAPAPGLFGLVGWSTRTLLRNRPLDVSLHEQDIRRAVGRSGNLDSPALRHSAGYLAESLGFVLAKKSGAPAGTTLRLDIDGHPPRAWTVTDEGRGRALDAIPDTADVQVACDQETFLQLVGGRDAATARTRVRVTGDHDLADHLLDHLAVTP